MPLARGSKRARAMVMNVRPSKAGKLTAPLKRKILNAVSKAIMAPPVANYGRYRKYQPYARSSYAKRWKRVRKVGGSRYRTAKRSFNNKAFWR